MSYNYCYTHEGLGSKYDGFGDCRVDYVIHTLRTVPHTETHRPYVPPLGNLLWRNDMVLTCLAALADAPLLVSAPSSWYPPPSTVITCHRRQRCRWSVFGIRGEILLLVSWSVITCGHIERVDQCAFCYPNPKSGQSAPLRNMT